jgi:hypothetical protein
MAEVFVGTTIKPLADMLMTSHDVYSNDRSNKLVGFCGSLMVRTMALYFLPTKCFEKNIVLIREMNIYNHEDE